MAKTGAHVQSQDAANASAWGARSTTARKSGRENREIQRKLFTRILYSKIHCFAAALSFSVLLSLRASV